MANSSLIVYRVANSTMAMWRDECTCRMCGAKADESDHVFGRGSEALLLKEHWMLRMSMCWPCHHKKHHGSGFDRVRQVKRLKNANSMFLGEEMETCYLALHRGLRSRMVSDLDKAIAFIDDWLEKNG